MPIPVTDYISTTDVTDVYPTHFSHLGKGGYHEVSTSASLDINYPNSVNPTIPIERRVPGMMAFVTSSKQAYTLDDTIDLNTWSLFSESGSMFYTNLESVPVTIGGIVAGQTFNHESIPHMFDMLLYPYQSPSFSSFSIDVTSPLEVGSSISAGNHTFSWTTTNQASISAGTIYIEDNITPIPPLATGLSNDGPNSISLPSAITEVTNTSHGWTIKGTNTNSVEFTKTYDVYWSWRIYYGNNASTSLTESDIKSLTGNILSDTIARTYSFGADNYQYKYFAYPSLLGTLTVFKDLSMNFDVAMYPLIAIVSVTNFYGVTTNYNVHRSLNMLSGAMNIQAW